MANIAAFFTDLTGTLAGAGVCSVSYANLSDDEAMVTHQRVAALAREVEKCVALSAADLSRRSDPALGQSGLSWRKGHVGPEALVQSLGGGSRVGARRHVTVGTMMAEAESAHELEKHNAEHPDLAVPVEAPWHALLGDAVTAGRVGAETANSIRNGLGEPMIGVTPEMLREALTGLIEECVHLNADQAHKAARRVRDEIDATGIAARAEAKRARQYLRVWVKPDGMVHGDFELDPENGMLFKDFYDQVTSPRRGGPRFVEEGKKAWAKELILDPRSTAHIAADALIEMLRVAAAADPGTVFGGNRPAVKVIVTQNTLTSQRGHGTLEGHPDPVPIETVDRHLCDTGFVPIMFNDDGQCVNVGRDKRLFTNRQRQGLAVRDGGCRWPDCDRPPSWAEAHHINPWVQRNGKININDGILLCRRHHMLLHNQGWEIVRHGAAEYWLVPPPTEDPEQTPILLPSKSTLKLETPIKLGSRRAPPPSPRESSTYSEEDGRRRDYKQAWAG